MSDYDTPSTSTGLNSITEDDEEPNGQRSMATSNSLPELLHLIRAERQSESYHQFAMTGISGNNNCLDFSNSTLWSDLFSLYFLEQPLERLSGDDMLFFVGSLMYEDVPTLQVARSGTKGVPALEDPRIDWEESLYLNIVMHCFQYRLTLAICTRTGANELEVLRKQAVKVYASPSRRQFDSKGTSEEITFPSIFFIIDNHEEVFESLEIHEGELVCVELIALDRNDNFQTVLFLGSVRYEVLLKVWQDKQRSLAKMMTQKWSNRIVPEFVKMRGPNNKGHAELKISIQPSVESNLSWGKKLSESTTNLSSRFANVLFNSKESGSESSNYCLAERGVKKSISDTDEWTESSQTSSAGQPSTAPSSGWFSRTGWFGGAARPPPSDSQIFSGQMRRDAHAVYMEKQPLRSQLTYVSLQLTNLVQDVLKIPEGNPQQPLLSFV